MGLFVGHLSVLVIFVPQYKDMFITKLLRHRRLEFAVGYHCDNFTRYSVWNQATLRGLNKMGTVSTYIKHLYPVCNYLKQLDNIMRKHRTSWREQYSTKAMSFQINPHNFRTHCDGSRDFPLFYPIPSLFVFGMISLSDKCRPDRVLSINDKMSDSYIQCKWSWLRALLSTNLLWETWMLYLIVANSIIDDLFV